MRAISGVMLVAMMIVTCLDVAGNAFGHPMLGSEEIVSLMAALLIAFMLPAAHQERAHIGVDLLYTRFSPNVKRINDGILCIIRIGFFLLVSWECVKYGLQLKEIGQVSATLELPTYYILYAIALGCFGLCLVIVSEFVDIVRGGIHE